MFDDHIFTLSYYLNLQGVCEVEDMFPSFRYYVLDADSNRIQRLPQFFEKSSSEIYTKAAQYIQDVEKLGSTLDEMHNVDIGGISQNLVVHSAKNMVFSSQGIYSLFQCNISQ